VLVKFDFLSLVIPAKAGIQWLNQPLNLFEDWTPAFAGVTTQTLPLPAAPRF
jgi:hypothetical protein